MALAEQHWFDLYDVRLKTDPYPIYERLLREPPFLTIIDGVEAAIFSRWPFAISGKPKAQPSATRCAEEGSMILVFGLRISVTASRRRAGRSGT